MSPIRGPLPLPILRGITYPTNSTVYRCKQYSTHNTGLMMWCLMRIRCLAADSHPRHAEGATALSVTVAPPVSTPTTHMGCPQGCIRREAASAAGSRSGEIDGWRKLLNQLDAVTGRLDRRLEDVAKPVGGGHWAVR